eukprot:Nitzschia sp. Nitz4//scaffold3_size479765//197502//199441//NITZ4_000081-RA/size479765-snap-gene-1.394-mRNA-1//-1//CDS//3329550701//5031//frame0
MSIRLFVALCLFRILNVTLIQSQFDPDEYWQNLEPAYCQVFVPSGETCEGLTWEWRRRPSFSDTTSISNIIAGGLQGPVRSYMSILPTLIYYRVLQWGGWDTSWAVSRGPVFLNAVLVTAPTDWSVNYLSRWMSNGSDSVITNHWCLFGAMTSWFAAYALTRTYSNSLETVLLAISLCLCAPELLGSASKTANHAIRRACLAFFLGGLSCSIRFTCLAAYVPMGVLLALQRRPCTVGSVFSYLLCVCAFFGLLGFMATLFLDYNLYGFVAIPLLGNLEFNVFQGTVLCWPRQYRAFLFVNLPASSLPHLLLWTTGNGRLYGTHPFHWYFSAGIPAIVGLLLPFLLWDFVRVKKWSRGRRVLWLLVGLYSVVHSFSAHKEFRFLLPVLPLLSVLAGENLQAFTNSISWKKTFLVLAVVANLGAVLYLGLFHQQAPIAVNRHILSMVGDHGRYNPIHIHYLMGCHSTPVLSHLHSPGAKIHVRTLDCSPACRADPWKDCESEVFARNPGQFVEHMYLESPEPRHDDPETCEEESIISSTLPDFVVTEAGNVASMQVHLEAMKMYEVKRFVQGIQGLQLPGNLSIGDISSRTFSLGIAGKSVILMLDEFVLFGRMEEYNNNKSDRG